MIAVQSSGCAPIVKAWQEGLEHAPVWENAKTIAAGIRVPVAVGDFLIIRAIKESDGFGIIVDDNEIIHIRDKLLKKMVCYCAQRELPLQWLTNKLFKKE